jgi:acetyl-CoA carboxylase carboxyl transferase subunit beta
MALFGKPKYTSVIVKKKDIPQGTYTKDPIAGDIVFTKELEQNQMVFPKSGFHYPISAPARLARLLDEGSFQEADAGLSSLDPLGFTGTASYTSKLEQYRKETGLNDAVVTGSGRIHGIEVSIACMDFRFLGASMGAVVGEKITRAIEAATAKKVPCIVICSSGGARMYEGIYSLMQMAKTSAALARHAQARLPYISILTNPTMAGVMASYATLGDVILAEPGAVVGFAGPRVIKETTKQSLPDGFQTAEFLLKHGLIDQIVSRLDMRDRLRDLLVAFAGQKRAA